MKQLKEIAKALGWHLTKRGNGYSMVNRHGVSCGVVLHTLDDVSDVLARRVRIMRQKQEAGL